MLTEEKITPENMGLFPWSGAHQHEAAHKKDIQEEGILCIDRSLLWSVLGDKHIAMVSWALFDINIYLFESNFQDDEN